MTRWLALSAIAAVAACSGEGAPARPATPVVSKLAPAREDEAPEPPDAAIVVPPGPPRPLDQDLPRLATRAVDMLRAIAVALDGADCAAATAKLGEIRRTYGDVIDANAKLARADRKAELAAAFAPQQAALDAAGRAVFHARALGACADQPAFAAAFDQALGAPASAGP